MRVLAMNPKRDFKDVRCLHVIVRYIYIASSWQIGIWGWAMLL